MLVSDVSGVDHTYMQAHAAYIKAGGGVLGGAMPHTTWAPAKVHHGYGATDDGLSIEPTKTVIKHTETVVDAPTGLEYTSGHTYTVEDDGKTQEFLYEKKADPLSTFVKFVNKEELRMENHLTGLAHWAMNRLDFNRSATGVTSHRRLLTDHVFSNANGTHEHFKVVQQGATNVHLTSAETDLSDPSALVNLTGSALRTALQTTRNPRTVISGTEAAFGLHVNDASAGDPHVYLNQQTATSDAFLHFKVDAEHHNVSNKRGLDGAFDVLFKGYDAQLVLQNTGHRLAVNDQGEEGKVYLGRWDNNLPNDADSDTLATFGDINMQGLTRFSDVPTNWNSGTAFGSISHANGLKFDKMSPHGSSLVATGAWDFTGATVTGISGGSGLANAVDMVGGIEVTGICQATEAFMFDGSATARWDENGFTPIGDVDFKVAAEVDFTGTTIVGLDSGSVELWGLTDDTQYVHCSRPLHGSNFGKSATTFTHYGESNNTCQINHKVGGGTAALYFEDAQNNLSYRNYCVSTFHDTVNIQRGDYTALVVDRMHIVEDMTQNYLVAGFNAYGNSLIEIATHETRFHKKIIAPNIDSSGNFTACHACEPVSQTISNVIGKLVKSSGVYLSRGDDGTKYVLPKNAPTTSHAMCSVELCETDADKAFLGIVSTVELVASEAIEHQHGGLHIHSKFAGEANGHKVLRVAASGDCMALVCGNGTSGQNVAVGDLITGCDTRKTYNTPLTLYEDGNDYDNGQGVTNIQFLTTNTNGYDYRIEFGGANPFYGNRTGALSMYWYDTTATLVYTTLYTVATKTITYTQWNGPNSYTWTSAIGATVADWQGGFLQRQGSDAVLNSSVAKCLMACDFSQSTAVLGATFGSVGEFVAEDGLTYRSCLVPVVFC
jgi:hypothetical protein